MKNMTTPGDEDADMSDASKGRSDCIDNETAPMYVGNGNAEMTAGNLEAPNNEVGASAFASATPQLSTSTNPSSTHSTIEQGKDPIASHCADSESSRTSEANNRSDSTSLSNQASSTTLPTHHLQFSESISVSKRKRAESPVGQGRQMENSSAKRATPASSFEPESRQPQTLSDTGDAKKSAPSVQMDADLAPIDPSAVHPSSITSTSTSNDPEVSPRPIDVPQDHTLSQDAGSHSIGRPADQPTLQGFTAQSEPVTSFDSTATNPSLGSSSTPLLNRQNEGEERDAVGNQSQVEEQRGAPTGEIVSEAVRKMIKIEPDLLDHLPQIPQTQTQTDRTLVEQQPSSLLSEPESQEDKGLAGPDEYASNRDENGTLNQASSSAIALAAVLPTPTPDRALSLSSKPNLVHSRDCFDHCPSSEKVTQPRTTSESNTRSTKPGAIKSRSPSETHQQPDSFPNGDLMPARPRVQQDIHDQARMVLSPRAASEKQVEVLTHPRVEWLAQLRGPSSRRPDEGPWYIWSWLGDRRYAMPLMIARDSSITESLIAEDFASKLLQEGNATIADAERVARLESNTRRASTTGTSRWIEVDVMWFYNAKHASKHSEDRLSCFKIRRTPFLMVPSSHMKDGIILGRKEQNKSGLEFMGNESRPCLTVNGRRELGVLLNAFSPTALRLHLPKPFKRLCSISDAPIKREVPREIRSLELWMQGQRRHGTADVYRTSRRPDDGRDGSTGRSSQVSLAQRLS